MVPIYNNIALNKSTQYTTLKETTQRFDFSITLQI